MHRWNQGWCRALSGLLCACLTGGLFAGGSPDLQKALLNPYPVPSLAGIEDWIHATPLSLQKYRGKVVLVYFWTYSSINSVRILPEVAEWKRKYGHDGLIVIGIHTPEFEFEKNPANVYRAVSRYGLSMPVGLDNDYRTWQNFHNNYWPALYLVNPQGYVVYQHFGEGAYSVTENNIRALLRLPGKVPDTRDVPGSASETPETYMGYDRAERFHGKPGLKPDRIASYSLPAKALADDEWGLQGKWTVQRDRAVAAVAGARFQIHFNAKEVYAVMSAKGSQSARYRVWLDGKLLKQGGGEDRTVSAPELLQMVSLPKAQQGVLEIEALSPGVAIYTVTFDA